jgi:tRNA (guanine-N1)-methyltransferase
LTVAARDLREFTDDRHRTVDDVPYGGGPGMVLKPEPLFRAVEAIERSSGAPQSVVLVSPHGRPFSQVEATRLAALERVVILCGRYEGIDDRVREHLATEELSIGDYVLSGGELPALVIVDALARLIPGGLVTKTLSPAIRSHGGSSTMRISRGRPSSEAGRFPMCWCRGTTGRFASGESGRHSS